MRSRAASVSSFLYMLVYLAGALSWHLTAANPFPMGPVELATIAGSALAAGVALAMIRERSLSLWPSAAALAAGGFLRLAVELWPPGG